MDIQASKLELVKLIVNIDNQSVIDRILKVLKSDQEDFWVDLSPQEKEEIEIGIKQLDAGHRTSLDEFLKKVS
ncbi:hypothetical protein N8911_01715 [bacterium]|jgi:hypothetical protein|nr:hypothetical protein [bacterium]MDC1221107.1 hypothetical protein [Salibacteraceae bacterium]